MYNTIFPPTTFANSASPSRFNALDSQGNETLITDNHDWINAEHASLQKVGADCLGLEPIALNSQNAGLIATLSPGATSLDYQAKTRPQGFPIRDSPPQIKKGRCQSSLF